MCSQLLSVVVDSDGCRYHGLTVMEIAVIE